MTANRVAFEVQLRRLHPVLKPVYKPLLGKAKRLCCYG